MIKVAIINGDADQELRNCKMGRAGVMRRRIDLCGNVVAIVWNYNFCLSPPSYHSFLQTTQPMTRKDLDIVLYILPFPRHGTHSASDSSPQSKKRKMYGLQLNAFGNLILLMD